MRRALAAVLALAAVATAGCGSQLDIARSTPTTAPPVPATSAPTSTATSAAPVVEQSVSLLSQPIASPAESYYDEPLVTIGHLAIPRLGLDTDVHQGLSMSTIDVGPSHWPGTALPGHMGNVTLAGHRVTHTRPFRHLDQLQPGDTATFTTDEGTFTYEFAGTEIVSPDRIDIATQWVAYTATMFACHPPGSARERIVAFWRLVSAPAPGQPDPAAYPPIVWPPAPLPEQ
jgi:sortase A